MNAAADGVEGAAAIAADLFAALNARDGDVLAEMLGPETEIVTGRNVHTGPEAIRAWAAKEYDHLTKRYAIDEYRSDGERVLALGSVQYVWTDGGEVGDSSPIAIEIELRGAAVRRLIVHDDTRTALAQFESRAGG